METALLVDPLAVFFAPALEGQPPLLLDTTHVDVELLPPLARVAVTRSFTNRSDMLVEAVLTLPAAFPDDVIHRLTVTIDGIAHDAAARPAGAAGRAHDTAIADGRLAILHERVDSGVQIISIAGIAAGAVVAVRIESIQVLRRLEPGVARLTVRLGADPLRLNIRLGDAEALTTVPDRHPATLVVRSSGVVVTAGGVECSEGLEMPIDCTAPLLLRIAALGDRSLDRSAFAADAVGGWEAVRDPVNDVASVVGERDDWISGMAAGVRVIAPAPLPGIAGLSDNARAMTAFAAAHVVAAAGQALPAALHQAANVLTSGTSLVFVGPRGVLPDALPVLRKVALPHAAFESIGFDGAEPVAPPPPEMHADPPQPDLPIKDEHIVPSAPAGQRRPFDWLALAPVVVAVVGFLGALLIIDVRLMPLVIGFAVLMLLNAVRHVPPAGSRRRLALLVLLLLPPLASFLGGPFGLVGTDLDAAGQAHWVMFQKACLLASPILPFLLLPALPGARRFTLDLGALAFMLTFFSASVAIITFTPGS